jgi:trk/ktr system potassium uptake protein
MNTLYLKKIYNPISLPIFFFLSAIIIGALLLHAPFSHGNHPLSFLDSLFTATSAVCVTGLTTVDTGTIFTRTGQVVVVTLIQLGGLGIMTFTSLAFYLWKKRISLTDRIAVGQSLLNDANFHLGSFLVQIVVVISVIEFTGAVLLFAFAPAKFPPFSAIFHAISAFCNAGFSLNSDSLMSVAGNWPVNFVIMALIILGGLGFSVIVEGKDFLASFFRKRKRPRHLSWHFTIVVKTSLFLVAVGAVYIYFSEFVAFKSYLKFPEAALTSLFQSVTCRTAGFNTLDIGDMTNASLVFMIFLMLVGGAPGSCAGGVKVTTFRVLWAFIRSHIRGRRQVVIGNYAVDNDTINKSLILVFFTLVLIFVCVILLDFSEGGGMPHAQVRGQFLELLFESVSAFGTVGLSTGLTAKLSPFGKSIIIMLMFIGRLGPLVLLSAIQSFQTNILFSRPEEKLSIG